jgi:hypothetical protein
MAIERVLVTKKGEEMKKGKKTRGGVRERHCGD